MREKRPGLALTVAGQSAGKRVQEALRAHGLKNNQAHLLMVLADEGATGQQTLVQGLKVDPSVLVSMLNDLESAGLAQRRRDPADRRRHIVEISPRGTQLVADVYASIESAEAELFASLDAREIDVLHKILIRINTTAGDQNCDDAGDTP
jgi:DNA-binding MarR family transcriptional regulator